jgi:hypothetical protein
MLRFIFLALLLLNGIYFAWSQGLLLSLGFAPAQQTEPHRVEQQIRPQALRLLTAQEQRAAEAEPKTVTKPAVCLQAGVFDAVQGELLRRTLAASLPDGAWSLDEAVEPARWIVYMGKFASAEVLDKKRAQLASLNLKFEPLGNPALGLGLSLGGYETQAAAQAALDALSRRGVRTARVVQERTEVRGVVLKMPAVDEALRTRLSELTPLLGEKALSPCR